MSPMSSSPKNAGSVARSTWAATLGGSPLTTPVSCLICWPKASYGLLSP